MGPSGWAVPDALVWRRSVVGNTCASVYVCWPYFRDAFLIKGVHMCLHAEPASASSFASASRHGAWPMLGEARLSIVSKNGILLVDEDRFSDVHVARQASLVGRENR